MEKIKYCKTCGFLDPTRPVCLLRGEQVDATADFCSKHQVPIPLGKCAICKQEVYDTNCVMDAEEPYRIYHFTCAKALNTCSTCALAQTCEFHNNPDPMPKVVMQTSRQGNMVMQQQVQNPARVEKFCHSCSCFDSENGCLKQFNCCGNWNERVG